MEKVLHKGLIVLLVLNVGVLLFTDYKKTDEKVKKHEKKLIKTMENLNERLDFLVLQINENIDKKNRDIIIKNYENYLEKENERDL